MSGNFVLEDSDDEVEEQQVPQVQEQPEEFDLPEEFLHLLQEENETDRLEEQKESEEQEEEVENKVDEVNTDDVDFNEMMKFLEDSEPEEEVPEPEPEVVESEVIELVEEPEIKDEDLDIDNLDNLVGQLKQQKRSRGRPKGCKVKPTTKMLDGLKKTRTGRVYKAIDTRQEKIRNKRSQIELLQKQISKMETEITDFNTRLPQKEEQKKIKMTEDQFSHFLKMFET